MEQVFAVVYITAPNAKKARDLASRLVEERLAACVNVVSGVESHYIWQGEVHTDPELLLVIKTRMAHLPALEAAAREITGYDTPEVLALPVAGGSEAYLKWLGESC